MEIPQKLRIKLPYDPPTPLLVTYPEKNTIQKDTCTPVSTAEIFTTARTWKQPRCPLTDEWIKKTWYIYTKEHCSAINQTEIEPSEGMWKNLAAVIQSEEVRKRTTNTVY